MRTPAALVTAALTAAILLTAIFLIATGTRGEGALPAADNLVQTAQTSPVCEGAFKKARSSRSATARGDGLRTHVTTICGK
jgi:hypothetical protein